MSSPSAFALAEQQEHIIAPDDSDFLDSDAEGTPHPDDHLIESAVLQDAPGAASSSSSPARRARSAAKGKLWPAHPLIRIHKRLWFTWFDASLPNEDELNLDAGHGAAWTNFDDGEVSKYVDAAETKPARLHWFNIDHDLVYLSFWFDWGPLNVGMFYRFCLHVHHMLTDPDMQDATLVLYTTQAPAQKANAALLATLYAMIIGKVSPADAFYPISELEFRPFRDAGYGRADYNLSIQDVLYGVQRAINHGLLDLTTFNLDEYEKYEQVHNGDWNWITPNFIAFASPNDRTYVEALRTGDGRLPSNYSFRPPGEDKLFGRTIRYFKERGVQLVVRLNNPLYDRDAFVQAGIQHADMYFDDGSNPTDDILADFIARADEVIRNDGVVAVHCKAGLGRTGVLIGAYLVWKHGFSAGEAIGFMRFMRPGCVVGPQQHFMYQNFVEWVKWGVRDHALADARKLLAEEQARLEAQYKPSTPPSSTTRAVKRRAAGSGAAKVAGDDSVVDEDDGSDTDAEEHDEVARPRQKHKRSADEAPVTPRAQRGGSRAVPASAAPGIKPAPCVGQPRKSPSPSRKRPAIQAPATVARLELNTRRYPTGASSFSQHLLRATTAVHLDADSDADENASLDTLAPGGSTAGVLVEARINVATPLRASPKAAVSTPSPVARVRGFERPRASTVGALATPVRTSSRSPSPASPGRDVVRASPGIRDRYGLRDSKSPPPATPPAVRTSRHPSPVKIAPLVARVTTDAEVLGVLACIPQTDRTSPPKPAPKPVAAVVDENARAPVTAPKVLRTVRSKPTLTSTASTTTGAGVRRGVVAGVRSVSARTPAAPVVRTVRAQKSSADLRSAVPSSRSVSSSSASSTAATVSRGASRLTAPTAASAARAAAAAAQRAKVAPPPPAAAAAAAGGVRKVSVLRPQAVRRRRSSTGQADVDLQ